MESTNATAGPSEISSKYVDVGANYISIGEGKEL